MNLVLAAQSAQGSGMSMIIMMVAIFAIMWFFMIRPQQKRQKEIQKFQNELTEGQQVVTGGGIYGTVKSIENIVRERDRDFFSLEKHVSPDTPPTFLWHTAADGDVPVENSLMFASALKRAGVPFELHIYPFGVHGLSLATKAVEQPEKKRLPDPHVAGWIDACGEWIQQMLDRP